MKRRELLQRVAGFVAASEAPVAVSVIASTPRPALAVLETAGPVSPESAERLVQRLTRELKGTRLEGVRVVVLGGGWRLTFIDEHGAPISRDVVGEDG